MERDDRKWKIRPPKGLAEYIRKNCAAHNYIIFSEKTGMACCTRCNEEFNYEDLGMWFMHSKDESVYVPCPICGHRAIPKNVRYGRKTLRDEGRIIWFRGIGRVTFMEMDDFIIDYTTPHPGIWVASTQQIRLTKDSQIRMDWIGGYGWADWTRRKAIRVKQPKTIMWGRRKEHTHVMWETLENLGTDLKYSNVKEERFNKMLFDEYDEAQSLITYLSDFLKHPAVELLEKAGFERLVMDRAAGRRTTAINIRAKELRKILRLNHSEVRYLQTINPSAQFVDDIYRIRKKWSKARIEDIEDLAEIFPRFMAVRNYEEICRNAEWPKVLKMLMENNRKTGRSMTLSDYGDYLNWVEGLGLRKDKRTIYPRDFQAAHDELMIKQEEAKDAVTVRLFRKTERELTGMTEPFVADGMLIRPADSPGELRKESSELNHCVRTYVSRVTQGTTSILFIRKEEDPDMPWFTLELNREGRIVQCRGKNNCSYPKEVEAFIEKWMTWRKKQLKAA